jgi:glycogen debranching enzyme
MNRFFLIVLIIVLGMPGFGQGIKGQSTRRHHISLGNTRKTDFNNKKPTLFLLGSETATGKEEQRTACNWIKEDSLFNCYQGTWEDIKKNRSSFNQSKIVWIHSNDTLFDISETKHNKELKNLRNYVHNGGKLLLTGDAFPLINDLQFEEIPVATKAKSAQDQGYGRKLGYHAYRDHPIFKTLFGGAYVWKPMSDTTVRIYGFFGDTVPKQGKVVAVDWDYIFMREKSKLIVEYQVGDGQVLAIGSYMALSAPNQDAVIMKLFVQNIIAYLADPVKGTPKYYWNYQKPKTIACSTLIRQSDRLFAQIPAARPWVLPETPVSFEPRAATDNYVEVAGERMLVMGKESGGIEEIWTHPFMALRDLRIGLISHGKRDTLWLDEMENQIDIRPDAIVRTWVMQGDTLKEVVAVDPQNPKGVIHLQHSGKAPLNLVVGLRSNLRLMWPYPASVIQKLKYQWNSDYNALMWADQSGDFCAVFGGNAVPENKQIIPAGDSIHTAIDLLIQYLLPGNASLDLILVAGNEGCDHNLVFYDEAIRNPEKIFLRAQSHIEELLASSLVIQGPDTNFNKGYLWALLATDRFFVNTPGMGNALVAGYATTRRGWNGAQQISGRPGYGWYFGRDGQWSGMAVLDYGDLDGVRENLELFIKYQAPSGKIFHEATTSGVIHYDAADATPLFVVLAGKYFRHSGDTAWVARHWDAIKKAISFCFSTDTDKDGFIENTMVGHGWVEGGSLFGCESTLYLQGCWFAALNEAYPMAVMMNDPDAFQYLKAAKSLKNKVNETFWLEQKGYYGYGMDADGTIRDDNTILQTVPAVFGILDPDKTQNILKPFSTNGFTTNWGVRIIDEQNPKFKPTGYHYGSVWPLFTGWTALAEYVHGRPIQGFAHLMNNLKVYQQWGAGYVEEVLNGAEYQPSGVCPHQCWSETMVLQPAIEGMLGLHLNIPEKMMNLAPALPADWDFLNADNIRIGDSWMTFHFNRTDSLLQYTLIQQDPQTVETLSFKPLLPPGTKITRLQVNNKELPYTTRSMPSGVELQATLPAADTINIECSYTGGISVLPVNEDPVPGSKPEGLRIVEAGMQGNQYVIIAEGLAGTTQPLFLWQQGIITKALVVFPASDAKYEQATITINQSN